MNLSCDEDLRQCAKHLVKQGNMVAPGTTNNGLVRMVKWQHDKNCLKTTEEVDTFLNKYTQTNLIALRCDNITAIKFNNSNKSAVESLGDFCEKVFGDRTDDECLLAATMNCQDGSIYLIYDLDPEIKPMELKDVIGIDAEILSGPSSIMVIAPTEGFHMAYGCTSPFPYKASELITDILKSRVIKRDTSFDKTMRHLDTKDKPKAAKKKKEAPISDKEYMKLQYYAQTFLNGDPKARLVSKCKKWLKVISEENVISLLKSINVTFVHDTLDEDQMKAIVDNAKES